MLNALLQVCERQVHVSRRLDVIVLCENAQKGVYSG